MKTVFYLWALIVSIQGLCLHFVYWILYVGLNGFLGTTRSIFANIYIKYTV